MKTSHFDQAGGINEYAEKNFPHCFPRHFRTKQDADADTRVVRRIARDTVERGRTLDSIMAQYQTYVKPMHTEWVEPSKTRADVLVNSETGHSVGIALKMIANHLRVESGIIDEENSSS
jgi:uridine kinase